MPYNAPGFVPRMRHSEAVAQQLLEIILVGTSMEYQSDQSHGEHDFNLSYSDGRVSAVEVTSSVDVAVKHTNARIRKGGQAVKTKLCKRDWWIQTEPGADVKKIRKEADERLAAVESAGIERFLSPIRTHPSVERICRDLGVYSGSVVSWKEPGYIWIDLRGGGGVKDASKVIEAAKREAYEKGNRRKLEASGTAERHLAVYVDRTNYLPWFSLVDCEPPAEPAQLPPEITDIWLFTEDRSQEYVVWRANALSPWRRIGPLALKVRT